MKKLVLLLILLVLAGCGARVSSPKDGEILDSMKVSNPKDGEIIDKIYTPAKTEFVTVHEYEPITGIVLPKVFESAIEPEKFGFEITFINDDGEEETLVIPVSRYDFSKYKVGDEYRFVPPSPPE